jgi:hypothetical protein
MDLMTRSRLSRVTLHDKVICIAEFDLSQGLFQTIPVLPASKPLKTLIGLPETNTFVGKLKE